MAIRWIDHWLFLVDRTIASWWGRKRSGGARTQNESGLRLSKQRPADDTCTRSVKCRLATLHPVRLRSLPERLFTNAAAWFSKICFGTHHSVLEKQLTSERL